MELHPWEKDGIKTCVMEPLIEFSFVDSGNEIVRVYPRAEEKLSAVLDMDKADCE